MDTDVTALSDQHRELAVLLDRLSADDWNAPTRCDGWGVRDVVVHLAQSDEMAVGSVTDTFDAVMAQLTDGLGSANSVDEAVASMVARDRDLTSDDVHARWTTASSRLVDALADSDLSTRVMWVAGQVSIRTLVTTRIAETWIHADDVAGAVGTVLPPSDRLRLVARLAWRTLPYAFAQADRQLHGPIAFRLTSPSGTPWDFLPDELPLTTIRGAATDLCAVAARRVDARSTSLTGDGPDASDVLALVRTYA